MSYNHILSEIKAYQNELVGIRRHIHQYPELSFQEFKTTQYIIDVLASWGLSQFTRFAETGIVIDLKGKNPEKKCIALRADIDALPIIEISEEDYKSTNGCMHACGHDVHTTVLLGAIKFLSTHPDLFEGTVRCIFQAGEELSPGGASVLIANGVLENPYVENVIGLHVFPELKVGEFGFRSGPYMASADEIHITINGQSGHAALPHRNHDPLDVTQHILSLLQSQIIKKNNPLNPCVLNFGHIAGGDTTNVIPEKVTMKGTLRTFNEKWRKDCIEIIHKTCKALSDLFGVDIIVNIPSGYPYLHNNEILTQELEQLAKDAIGLERVFALDQRMTAEDFSFYAQHRPSMFFRLGTNNDQNDYSAPVHNNRFNVDENCLYQGSALMAHFAIHLLNK